MRNILRIRIFTAALSTLAFLCFSGRADAQGPAAREFNRLRTLQSALAKIPMEKQEKEPHKSFIKKHERNKDIVYSEPAGQWYVRSELFWSLRDRYNSLPIAEDIAWVAAQNPIPGECEGYINCYMYVLTATDGRYLSYYPNGKHSGQAFKAIVERLEPLAADDSQYDGPTDATDRPELKKNLAELRYQIARSNNAEKAKALALIGKLEAKHK